MRFEKATSWKLAGVSALALGLMATSTVSYATIVAYDGFADGGTADGRTGGATAYTTSPAATSGSGTDNDSLSGQSPIATGFADGDAWAFGGTATLTNLYWKAGSGGLTYADYQPNTSGQAQIFNTAGNMTSVRSVARSASTTDTSDVQWVAMLLDFSSAPADMLTDNFNIQLGYSIGFTPANFGVNADGKAYFNTETGSSKIDVETASALGAGTHLLLLKFDAGSAADARYDDVTLWVDPILTADPNDLSGGLAARGIIRADIAGTLGTFDEIKISTQSNVNTSVIFDEFIIANDYQNIYQVPEPGSLALLGLGGLLIARRRRDA